MFTYLYKEHKRKSSKDDNMPVLADKKEGIKHEERK